MTGDPLDSIEERAAPPYDFSTSTWAEWSHDVLALVEVARAARYLIELRKHDRGPYYERTAWKDLAAALANVEAALDRVEAEIARLERGLDEARREKWSERGIMLDLQARAEAAEAEVARLRDEREDARAMTRIANSRAARLRDGLRWYAERRNYVPAAPPAVPPPKHLMDTDAWDGGGPGARARALLSEDGAA